MAHGGHRAKAIRKKTAGIVPRRSFYSFILFSGSISKMGVPLFSGRGMEGIYLCCRQRGRAFFRYPLPPYMDQSSHLPPTHPPTTATRPAPRGRGYTQPRPRPGDNINHRGGGGTCKERNAHDYNAPVMRCNRSYLTSPPVLRNALSHLKMRLRPLLPSPAPSSL